MTRNRMILTTALWATVVAAMIGLVGLRAASRQAASASEANPSAPLFTAPTFELTDQNGRAFKSTSLSGKIWIADFIFTNCAGPCPVMTRTMADLQKKLPQADIRFVSFSVDPDHDSPAILKAYAQKFEADESRWSFVTGDKAMIASISRSMLAALQEASADQPIIHSEKFLLMDRNGRCSRVYSSRNEQEMKQLIADAAALATGEVR